MPTLKKTDDGNYIFQCPGCDEKHFINDRWQFDGNFEKPTISPSILVTWPAQPDAEEEFKEWRTERRCHSFIKNGQIQFLDDCTHTLKGQTIDLPKL